MFQNEKYENNLRNHESQKNKKITFTILIHNSVYVMFYYKIPSFYQDFENQNLCFFKSVLSSQSENTAPVTRDHVKSSQMRNQTPLQP